jgi:outer membrane biosynthesis protein TonB
VDAAAETCAGCGRPLRAGAEFCGYCGTKAPERRLAAPPDPPPPPAPEPVLAESVPEPEPEREPEPEPEPIPEPDPEPTPVELEPEPERVVAEAAAPPAADPLLALGPEVAADDDAPSDDVSYAELYAAADAPEPKQQTAGRGRFRASLTLALAGLMLICVAAYLVSR